jgi:MerR family transcriptional regulator/heat shock protein HspR
MQSPKIHRIGEVAHLTGLHPNTIRNLELRGLVRPGRDWNGQRRYTAADVKTLRALVTTQRRTSQRRSEGA